MLDRVRTVLQQADWLTPGDTGVLAVSGGPDSMALLDLMAAVASEFQLHLVVGHVDHGIDPDSSRAAQAVLDAAHHYGLVHQTCRLHLGPDASETTAREARYRALIDLQRGHGARWVATAHHADDQIETVLFRVIKGSGTLGLAGMGPRGPIGSGVVRPLLDFRRAELADWLEGRSGPCGAHEDPMNTDLRHDRAWVRGQLLPLLRDRFGGEVEDRILTLGRHAAQNRAAWAAILHELPGLDFQQSLGTVDLARSALAGYEKPLALAILRAAALEAGCVAGPARADRLHAFVLSSSSGRRFELGGGWQCEIAFDRVRIARPGEVAPPVEWGSGADGCVEWNGWVIHWSEEVAGALERDAWRTWVTPGSGTMRSPAAGDRLRPLRGVGRRRVARLLMEKRVPRTDRRRFPVLVRDGEILWLPGVCRAEAALPAPGEMAMRLDVRDERP